MQWLAIVTLTILACITYGIIHDQVTARICLEYFTIGHPQIVPTDDPTVLDPRSRLGCHRHLVGPNDPRSSTCNRCTNRATTQGFCELITSSNAGAVGLYRIDCRIGSVYRSNCRVLGMGLAGRLDRGERTTGKTRYVSCGSLVAQRRLPFRICRGYHTGDLGLTDSCWTSLESKSELRHARERPNRAESDGSITPAAP
jgi:hypothetical protein